MTDPIDRRRRLDAIETERRHLERRRWWIWIWPPAFVRVQNRLTRLAEIELLVDQPGEPFLTRPPGPDWC